MTCPPLITRSYVGVPCAKAGEAANICGISGVERNSLLSMVLCLLEPLSPAGSLGCAGGAASGHGRSARAQRNTIAGSQKCSLNATTIISLGGNHAEEIVDRAAAGAAG